MEIEGGGVDVSNLGSQRFIPMDAFREVISLLKEKGRKGGKGQRYRARN